MKILFTTIALLCGVSAEAQLLATSQSSPSLNWYSISNDSVQLIYPEQVAPESEYIANLVEHYSHVVGKTYGIDKPEKFSLIIRPEVAQPNGFVTLAPRRSEWFSSASYSPIVGSLEWYQILSIHEYRHVNQFDHFNRSTVKALRYITGDLGQQFATFLALPSWYLEGDAVWAETKYTDAGRGRLPRFMARLKALVLSDKLPTYDQFVFGSYKTSLPNQYVYGYALISYATQKYGENVWKEVTEDIAKFPHPFRIYSSFSKVTGQSFESFYYETMEDLAQKWSVDKSEGNAFAGYSQKVSPFKVADITYYVQSDMEFHPAVYKVQSNVTEKIYELPYNREMSGLSVSGNKLVYTEYLADARYGMKGSADLFLIDLKDQSKTKLTNGLRLYNPSLSFKADRILATQFDDNLSWGIALFDTKGKMLKSFTIKDHKVAEAKFLDDKTAVAVITSANGERSIVKIDLDTQTVSATLLPATRNLIFNIQPDANQNFVFEAQYKGGNDIFRMSATTELSRCTNSKLGAYTPSTNGTDVFYANATVAGIELASIPVSECQAFDGAELVGYKYLGTSPSDNYNGFPVVELPTDSSVYKKNASQYKVEEYGDFDRRLFIPHSWGLLAGRGGSLGFKTDNYLRTLSFQGSVGTSAEELRPFSSLDFVVSKYYPIFTFTLENVGRNVEDFVTTDETRWTENTAGLSMTLPYLKQRGLFGFTSALTLGGSYVDASKYQFNTVEVAGSNYFYKSFAKLNLSWSKEATARSVQAPWLLSYTGIYENAERPGEEDLSSFRFFQKAQIQTPAFTKVDGFMFSFDHQRQRDLLGSYRFIPQAVTPSGYAFSRGYKYRDIPEYQKASANYVTPISYPDISVGRFYYLKRVSGLAFFDSTKVEDLMASPTLNSYGAELHLESYLFRVLPMTIGFRYVHRELDSKDKTEFFLGTSGLFQKKVGESPPFLFLNAHQVWKVVFHL